MNSEVEVGVEREFGMDSEDVGIDSNEDFGFYGEDEDAVVGEKKGITGEVTSYAYTNLAYPCFMFKQGFTCERHKMKVLSNMINAKGYNKDIAIYFREGEDTFKIGAISGQQVSFLLDIIGLDNLEGYYDDGTKLEGSKMYVLCSV